MRYVFLITLLSFLLASVPSHGLEITFKKHAEVSKNHVTLGDIVSFDHPSELTTALSTKIISSSPEPGSTITLDAREVIKQIHRKTSLPHSAKWVGAASIAVHRPGQQIGTEQILAAVRIFLEENKAKLPKANISFIPRSLPLPFMVPQGPLDWEVVPSNPVILKSNRFSIILRVDGRVRKNMSITGQIKALAPVAVATTNLKRGTVLTPDNTILVTRDITAFDTPCLSLRTILGKRLKHSVRAGNAIESSQVEFPPLVRKGQLVKIILNQGPLYITATGVARMNGKLNEVIRVQNTNSNKLIFCRIAAPGIVEVII